MGRPTGSKNGVYAHGSVWTYWRQECRCDACTAAHDAHLIARRKTRVGMEERFWAKVAWTLDDWGTRESPCWLWLAATNVKGYGLFSLHGGSVLAHRLAYELEREEIPEGLGLDHLCHNPACVNPWHLEAVTTAVNTDRKLRHCPSCTCKETS